MHDFFQTMSFWGGILAMLLFISAAVIYLAVVIQGMNEDEDTDEPMLYDWETME